MRRWPNLSTATKQNAQGSMCCPARSDLGKGSLSVCETGERSKDDDGKQLRSFRLQCFAKWENALPDSADPGSALGLVVFFAGARACRHHSRCNHHSNKGQSDQEVMHGIFLSFVGCSCAACPHLNHASGEKILESHKHRVCRHLSAICDATKVVSPHERHKSAGPLLRASQALLMSLGFRNPGTGLECLVSISRPGKNHKSDWARRWQTAFNGFRKGRWHWPRGRFDATNLACYRA